MASVLVLDTCVLPFRGSVHANPLLSALLRAASIREVPVHITDISLAESLNKRMSVAVDAVDSLLSAVRSVATVFGFDEIDYYIPAAVEAVDTWRQELVSTFVVLETDGRDALEALRREAMRVPPARATDGGSATGGRDASIWLCVKRMHLENDGQRTIFISTNTKDFGAKDGGSILRGELLEELGSASERFVYLPSLEAAIDELAVRVDAQEWSAADLGSLVESLDLDRHLLDMLVRLVCDRDSLHPESLDVRSVSERRAYTVDSVRLSQIDVEFECDLESEDGGSASGEDSTASAGSASAWLYREAEGSSFEVTSITFAGARFRSP